MWVWDGARWTLVSLQEASRLWATGMFELGPPRPPQARVKLMEEPVEVTEYIKRIREGVD